LERLSLEGEQEEAGPLKTASTSLSGIPNPLLPDSRQIAPVALHLENQGILPKP
jgi:hypothetical protein